MPQPGFGQNSCDRVAPARPRDDGQNQAEDQHRKKRQLAEAVEDRLRQLLRRHPVEHRRVALGQARGDPPERIGA